MASGSPDWWIRTKTDIVAQTLAQLDVDIIAQTVGNLNVDIIAQTLANLNVDIIAQTLANLKVDINAQTIANLAVDIVAQTLANLKIDINAQTLAQVNIDIIAQTLANLKVDINAQTIGNLAVDLNAQTIGNLAIDINAQTIENLTFDLVKQTLDFLTVRPAYGSAVGDNETIVCAHNEDTRIFYQGGQGIIYDFFLDSDFGNSPAGCQLELKVDGERFFYRNLFILYQFGMILGVPYRLVFSRYDALNDIYTLVCGSPITFETSFEIRMLQATGAAVDVNYDVSYALTP